MAGLTVQQAFEQALQHQQAGRMPEAVALYRQIIAQRPKLAEVHNNLGNALKAMGRLDEAEKAYRQALSIRSDISQIHNNLGSVLHERGQYAEAHTAYQRALSLRADYPEAQFNLGNNFFKLAQIQKAIDCFRQAIALWPNYAEAHCNLANSLAALSRRDEAIIALRQAVWLRPNYPDAWNNLGNELRAARRYGEAISAYKRAISQNPDFIEAYNNLGNALRDAGRLDEAIEAYQQAIVRRREYPEAFYNLGLALSSCHRFDEALEVYRHAIQLRPDFADAHRNLAGVLKEIGQVPESLEALRQALQFKADPHIGSDLVYSSVFIEEDPQKILAKARGWNERFAQALSPPDVEPATADGCHRRPGPSLRLRLGYISPGFRRHTQSLFMVPLLTHHRRDTMEVFCYSDVACPDEVTDRLVGLGHHWQNIVDLSDESVAKQIKADGIDILVDLTLHMANNRLLVLARKPAPVQVTWLAYPGTTGLTTIDYRISDPYLDPQEVDERVYSEKTYRLPHTFWCYDPLTEVPAVNELPAATNGFITFGCLNNFCKITPATVVMWSEVMRSVPGSRLIVLAPHGSARHRFLASMQYNGIEEGRIEFVDRAPRDQYLLHYHRMDIGLDTFPYPGHTTSLDSFWMGVPVVTRSGRTAISRSGLSILSNLGLGELVATDADQYVRLAVELSRDIPRLAELRRMLRSRMQSSPLMDGPQFARDMEDAYRQMWRSWCDR